MLTGLNFALQCPGCGMYDHKGAATDLVPMCRECHENQRDRDRIAEEARVWSGRPCTVPHCGRFVGDCPHPARYWETAVDQYERMYRRAPRW